MKEVTRDFVLVALRAMEKAYYYESDKMNNYDTDIAKKVGEVLQAISDLSRHP